MPMIGMSRREGPWPRCLKLDGESCCKLVESYAKDVRGNCIIVHDGDEVENDFDKTRVRVYVDSSDAVTAIPDRG